MKYLLFPLFVLLVYMSHAQRAMDGAVSMKLDQAVELLLKGQYEAADKEFRELFTIMETLPSDLAYYFGRNSYHLQKYKQSINWLNKYIQLKGTRGRFYEEATRYLQYSEEEYIKENQARRKNMESDLSGGEYDCGGLAKMICPVCHGNGVVIKKGAFENLYTTCPYSLGESFLSCEEYNLFMKGSLKPKLQE